jgi:glycosyltransferase involved in cell wall biosynthesis
MIDGLGIPVTRRKVAVLMSCYAADKPNLLKRSLNSLLTQERQDLIDIRIYLGVDGPVGDDLMAVLVDFEYKLERLVLFPSNRGLAHVLNDLIRELKFEDLIFRMDSDDMSLPPRFIRQIEFMDANPEIDILGTAIIEKIENDVCRVVKFPKNHVAAARSICWRTPFAHPSVCIRKTVLDTLHGYPTDALNEDIALWFRALKSGFQFANLQEALLEFNVDPRFWSRRGLPKAWGEFKCYIFGIYENEGLTWRMMFPLARLLFRLSPTSLRQYGYKWRSLKSTR